MKNEFTISSNSDFNLNQTDHRKSNKSFARRKFNSIRFKLCRFKNWLKKKIHENLNFYRCHLIAFILIPILFSIIFYVADDQVGLSKQPKFLDCLFMCYSAMTMTGLNTILLASLNRFQQVLLFILMSIGSTTMVSIIMVYLRLGAFQQRFKSIIKSKKSSNVISNPIPPTRHILPENQNLNSNLQNQSSLILNDVTLHSSNFSFLPKNSQELKNDSSDLTIRPFNRSKQIAFPSTMESQSQFTPTKVVFTNSPINFNFPKQITSNTTRPPLLRWNSDGGVVGARFSFNNSEHAPPVYSNQHLSILKHTRFISDSIPSNKITLNRSIHQSTKFNPDERSFPRSVTLDQSPSFQQARSAQFCAGSLAQALGLNSSLRHNLSNSDRLNPRDIHQITPSPLADIEKHASPFSSFDLSSRNHGGANSVISTQVVSIPGLELDLPSHEPPPPTSQRRRTRESLPTFHRNNTAEGLRRRVKHSHSSSASNTQHHGPPLKSIPSRGSRFFHNQHSTSGQSHPTPVMQDSHPFFPRKASIEGFGGFPNPIVLLFKKTTKRITRAFFKENHHSLEFVRTSSLAAPTFDQKEKHKLVEWLFGFGADAIAERIRKVKTVSYIKFNAIVGRNSNFLTLTLAQEEELGGLEYRALSILLKIAVGYWIILQLLALVILIPYLETPIKKKRFSEVFESPGGTNRLWYAIWITCSSFTNGGMSLIDAGFTVFQDAYLLMLTCSILIVAGNTGYPIFLRSLIWILSKTCHESTPEECRKIGGGSKDVLNFLLDHPRRCFVYLFPSRQTWYLFLILLALTFIDWIGFLLLDIGNPKIESMPLHTRAAVGLLQSLSVRAAGFSTVALGDLSPAVQVLFVIMMYIAVYPIAISIRATNVYEEQSMGIFDPQELHQRKNLDAVTEDVSPRIRNPQESPLSLQNANLAPSLHPNETDDNIKSTSSYFAFHIRQQLAFDIWWLALAVWCICIAERNKIVTAETPNSSFSIFSIIFEVVSAYGTIGLSFGLPDSATSMVGGFSSFSKLIVIAVMLRGRHRGLPIAIDRAVMFPFEKAQPDAELASETEQSETQERRQQDDIEEILESDIVLSNSGDIESQ